MPARLFTVDISRELVHSSYRFHPIKYYRQMGLASAILHSQKYLNKLIFIDFFRCKSLKNLLTMLFDWYLHILYSYYLILKKDFFTVYIQRIYRDKSELICPYLYPNGGGGGGRMGEGMGLGVGDSK